MYNLQSGLPRGSFPTTAAEATISAEKLKQNAATPGNVWHEYAQIIGKDDKAIGKGSLQSIKPILQKSAKDNKHHETETADIAMDGHTADVTGLFVDYTLGVLASCSLDGALIIWDFESHRLLHVITVNAPLIQMVPYRDGSFVALVGEDRIVRVYDLCSRKLSRRFAGHDKLISDVAFSPDGRRLVTGSHDCTVRVWDMPTGRCLSWMQFESAVLSLAVSISGEYLSLSLDGKPGVQLYADRSFYETIHFWAEPVAPVEMNACEVKYDRVDRSLDEEGGLPSALYIEDDVEKNDRDPNSQPLMGSDRNYVESKEQKGESVITLSALPKAYWMTLFNFEEIKERNKPVEPPKAPPQAPFFLPSVVREGSTPSFPTPEEYHKMVSSASEGNIKASVQEDPKNTRKRGLSDTRGEEAGGKKSSKKGKGASEEGYHTNDVLPIAPMEDAQISEDDIKALDFGSVWHDDDEDVDEDVDKANVEEMGSVPNKKSKKKGSDASNKIKSRIIKKQMSLPRCVETATTFLQNISKSTAALQAFGYNYIVDEFSMNKLSSSLCLP